MVKQGLDITAAYSLIFIPLIVLFAMGQVFLFIAWGGVIASGVFFFCLASTIRQDLAQRKTRKQKGKRHG